MTWTHEKPKASGYYWMRYARPDNQGFSEAQIVDYDARTEKLVELGNPKPFKIDNGFQFYSTPITPPEC